MFAFAGAFAAALLVLPTPLPLGARALALNTGRDTVEPRRGEAVGGGAREVGGAKAEGHSDILAARHSRLRFSCVCIRAPGRALDKGYC